jgi:hypothetical protein
MMWNFGVVSYSWRNTDCIEMLVSFGRQPQYIVMCLFNIVSMSDEQIKVCKLEVRHFQITSLTNRKMTAAAHPGSATTGNC